MENAVYVHFLSCVHFSFLPSCFITEAKLEATHTNWLLSIEQIFSILGFHKRRNGNHTLLSFSVAHITVSWEVVAFFQVMLKLNLNNSNFLSIT